MTTRPALDALKDFLTHRTTYHASLLIDIPALYNILRHERGLQGEYSDALISVCNWIYKRGRSVLDQLLMHGSVAIPANIRSEYLWSTVSELFDVTYLNTILTG